MSDLLFWPRVARAEEIGRIVRAVRPKAVLAWGFRCTPRDRAAADLADVEILHPDDLLPPAEALALDRELTAFCRTWHGRPDPPPGAAWDEPAVVLATIGPTLRQLGGQILALVDLFDRARARGGWERLHLPARSSLHADPDFLDDVARDWTAARGIEAVLHAIPDAEKPAFEPPAPEPSVLSCLRTRFQLRPISAPRDPILPRWLLAPAIVPERFREEVDGFPDCAAYLCESRKGLPRLSRLARARKILRGVQEAAPAAPAPRGVPLGRTWPARWKRHLRGSIRPALLLALAEEEGGITPDVAVESDWTSARSLLRRRRLVRAKTYIFHLSCYVPATGFFPSGDAHIGGLRFLPDALAARGSREPALAYPDPAYEALLSAGPPPESWRRAFDAKRAGKRGVVFFATSCQSPHFLYIHADEQERGLDELLPWMASRRDLLFVFKPHPGSDKDHNAGRGAKDRIRARFEELPEANRWYEDGGFDATIRNALFASADVVLDSYSSLVWEALAVGRPAALFDPFGQPYLFHDRLRNARRPGVRYAASAKEIVAWAERILDDPAAKEEARADARAFGAEIHLPRAEGWRGRNAADLPPLRP